MSEYQCCRCKRILELNSDNFQPRKDRNLGYRNHCKRCATDEKRKWREKNKERDCLNRKKWVEKNRQHVYAVHDKWLDDNRDHYNAVNRAYRKKDKEKDREKYRTLSRNNMRARLKNDPEFRLLSNLRARVRGAIKFYKGEKLFRTMELIGCSIHDVKLHLESKFTEGMSWENYGKWHIDHIIPCCAFNLIDPQEQLKCFHYTNLQPLWAEDNLKKGDKIIKQESILG
jgi:hypothetical protein